MNIRTFVFAGLVGAAGLVWAADTTTGTTAKPKLTPEERAARREKMLQKTGGIIDSIGKGKLVFVNCQDFIEESEIKARADLLQHLLHYNVEYRTGAWTLGTPKPEDATVAVYVVNDAKLPMSLLAIEERWGVVNVAGLKAGKRYGKELVRIATLAMGSWKSQVVASPLQVVSKPSDLDLLRESIGMDSASAIEGCAKVLGMTRNSKTSYLKACQEGWAPAPTNHYQKAIWDKVHQLPTNPIKILPETKPVKE